MSLTFENCPKCRASMEPLYALCADCYNKERARVSGERAVCPSCGSSNLTALVPIDKVLDLIDGCWVSKGFQDNGDKAQVCCNDCDREWEGYAYNED